MQGQNAQAAMSAIALLVLGALAGFMCFVKVPTENHDYLVFILGALSGALTTGGVAQGIHAVNLVSGQANGPEAQE